MRSNIENIEDAAEEEKRRAEETIEEEYVCRCCLLCVYMPAIDRPLHLHAGD